MLCSEVFLSDRSGFKPKVVNDHVFCVHIAIGMISVHINFCVINVCSQGGGDILSSEQLDFAGFTVFLNCMNNYPGVAASSEEMRQTLPGYRPQPARRKTCQTPY